MRAWAVLCLIVLAVSVPPALIAPSAAAAPAPSVSAVSPFVALGDSYSSGEGNAPYDPRTSSSVNSCHRSQAAYAPQLAVDHPGYPGKISAPSLVACSGAITDDLFRNNHDDNLLASASGTLAREPGQLKVLTAQTKLVTLTIGGNDVGFANVLRDCVVLPVKDPHCRSHKVAKAATRNIKILAGKKGYKPTSNQHTFVEVIKAIHHRAPNAQILIGGYPRPVSTKHWKGKSCQVGSITLFGTSQSAPVVIYREDAKWLGSASDNLNSAIKAAVKKSKVKSAAFVPASGFDGHEVCSAEPYLNPVSGQTGLSGETATPDASSFHPNAAGQDAYRKAFLKQLKKGGPIDWSTPTAPTADPLTFHTVLPARYSSEIDLLAGGGLAVCQMRQEADGAWLSNDVGVARDGSSRSEAGYPSGLYCPSPNGRLADGSVVDVAQLDEQQGVARWDAGHRRVWFTPLAHPTLVHSYEYDFDARGIAVLSVGDGSTRWLDLFDMNGVRTSSTEVPDLSTFWGRARVTLAGARVVVDNGDDDIRWFARSDGARLGSAKPSPSLGTIYPLSNGTVLVNQGTDANCRHFFRIVDMSRSTQKEIDDDQTDGCLPQERFVPDAAGGGWLESATPSRVRWMHIRADGSLGGAFNVPCSVCTMDSQPQDWVSIDADGRLAWAVRDGADQASLFLLDSDGTFL